MATTTIHIDDRDSSSIIYSRPESGYHWVDQSSRSSDAYQSTLKLTRTRGAGAIVVFEGTSITVVGAIANSGSIEVAPSSDYQIDGGSLEVYKGNLQANDQYHVEFFRSGTLPMAFHILTIRNLAEGSFLWLDQFIVTQDVKLPPSDPDPSPDPTPVVSVTTTVIPTLTIAPTSSGTPTVNSRSSTVGSPGSSSSSTTTLRGSSTITRTLSPSKSNSDSSVSSSTPAAITAGNNVEGDTFTSSSSPRDKESPVGAIVGFVLGGLSVLLVILLIALWVRRRFQSKQEVKYTDPEREPNSGYANPIPEKLTSPFQSSSSEPYSATSPQSETSSGSTPMSEPDPTSRAALVQTWRRTLGIGAHSVGKRQLIAFNGVASPTDTDDPPMYLPVGQLGAGERVIDHTSVIR